MFKVWSANGYFWLIESITIWQKIFEKAQITAGSRPRLGPGSQSGHQLNLAEVIPVSGHTGHWVQGGTKPRNKEAKYSCFC